MTIEHFVTAGNVFHCIKCKKFFGRVNKMDGTGSVDETDLTKEEYILKTKAMEAVAKNSGIALLTSFLEGKTCNKCLSNLKITYFVHGTTTDNERDLATGWTPGELSEIGIQQSKKLGDMVADQEFAVVFCSDLKRAVDSAQLAFGSKYEIIPDARLREANYGDFTQTATKAFKYDLTKYIDQPFPNGESYKDVEKRIADFLKEISQKYDGKHIAIVAHHAPQLALDVLLKGKTWEQAIAEDWRLTKSWQPGWNYEVKS